ncbi:hypothetical protein BJP62_16675 [Jeongeupia sp. USM3]|nr:hypothetical protein BJP62_16675 [Jeongeupia sp. USM3]
MCWGAGLVGRGSSGHDHSSIVVEITARLSGAKWALAVEEVMARSAQTTHPASGGVIVSAGL